MQINFSSLGSCDLFDDKCGKNADIVCDFKRIVFVKTWEKRFFSSYVWNWFIILKYDEWEEEETINSNVTELSITGKCMLIRELRLKSLYLITQRFHIFILVKANDLLTNLKIIRFFSHILKSVIELHTVSFFSHVKSCSWKNCIYSLLQLPTSYSAYNFDSLVNVISTFL